jgi:4-cresol dehydrogenase (hydroxylating)
VALNDNLPPNVSPRAFDAFLKACVAVVGTPWVKTAARDVEPYGRDAIPFGADVHMPSAAVCPQSLEEVRVVVAAAQEARVPLWPTSTGRNIGYGASSVADRGTVVLDMRRMNRILDFDPELGTVVVEPGVTYQQLHDFIGQSGHDFWLDFPGPGPIVSPMGNTLERGHGVTPYGDHFAHSCGYEVLLADGTLFRTGMGGIKDGGSWQAFRYGYGPTLDGIFTQSNFGIVTKMGIWLMPAPAAHKTIIAHWPNDDDIIRLTGAVRGLRLDGTIPNEGVMGNATIFLAATKRRADVFSATDKAIPLELPIAEMKKVGLGAWNYVFTLYGRPDRVESDWQEAKRRLEDSGASLIPDAKDEQQVNELTLKSFALFNWIGGGGLAWCAPVSPMCGTDMQRQFGISRDVMGKYGVDFMVGTAFGERAALNVMPLLYDRNDADQMGRVRACYGELIDRLGASGFGMYRTSIGYMDQVAKIYGEPSLAVNRRIKRALDPHGIIAPGKSGIRL